MVRYLRYLGWIWFNFDILYIKLKLNIFDDGIIDDNEFKNIIIHYSVKKLGYFYLYFFNMDISVNIVRRLFKSSMVILDTITEGILTEVIVPILSDLGKKYILKTPLPRALPMVSNNYVEITNLEHLSANTATFGGILLFLILSTQQLNIHGKLMNVSFY